jgi:hypothetical protein
MNNGMDPLPPIHMPPSGRNNAPTPNALASVAGAHQNFPMAVAAVQQRKVDGSMAVSAAVAAAQSAAAAHSATAAARWQGSSMEAVAVAAAQQCNVGGSGTIRECANARAFERHRRANVRLFVLGRGQRDDSVDSIIVVSSDGVAHQDVHCGRRCAAATNDDDDGNADDILCETKLNQLLLFMYLPLRRL